MKGKVYLVGAGCGDPELITWKGLNLLRKCDVVLYDDLVASKLLEETKQACELIFVGKRYGKHSLHLLHHPFPKLLQSYPSTSLHSLQPMTNR